MTDSSESRNPAGRSAPGRKQSSEQAIIAAAQLCFERFGIKKTSMEDIAQEAGVSRATMYRHFTNKDAIVEAISIVEAENVNRQIRAQLAGRASLEDTLVECMFLATRIAHENSHIRVLLDYPGTTSVNARPNSVAQQRQRAMWGNLLQSAAQRHSFAADLEIDDLVRWLLQSQDMLLRMVEAEEIPDAELRWFIRRFVVFPMLDRAKGTV
ncbi:TetR/AcrR family transcriptional regulator [Sphingopyxis sp. R3-92]|uniref:TetR/AcrR family transcriptional regulator n=1 Tax=Sphingopyxis sp. R3-92 TaxID=3158553 RepID=UPI003EE46A45